MLALSVQRRVGIKRDARRVHFELVVELGHTAGLGYAGEKRRHVLALMAVGADDDDGASLVKPELLGHEVREDAFRGVAQGLEEGSSLVRNAHHVRLLPQLRHRFMRKAAK